jgi:hypothetical protein
MTSKLALSLLLIFVTAIAFAPLTAQAEAKLLFAKGTESFKIENTKGQTPTFRVLSDSMTKQALAMATISMLNAQEDVQPKIPLNSYIDLKFQTLTLTPQKGRDLQVTLKLSGYSVDLDQMINKEALLQGKEIEVVYPKTSKDVAVYTVESNGRLKMHLDKASQVLILENVEAKMTFESPLGDDGSEKIQFSGKAKRIL